MTGTGSVGYWESVSWPTPAWKLAGFTDANSISVDPTFVNASGADGQLGFTNFADHGTDDDFHEQSTAGSFHGGSSPASISNALPTAVSGTYTADAITAP